MQNVVCAVFNEEETLKILNHNGEAPYIGRVAIRMKPIGLLQEYTNPKAISRNLFILMQKEF